MDEHLSLFVRAEVEAAGNPNSPSLIQSVGVHLSDGARN
jgi:hypothetical protein